MVVNVTLAATSATVGTVPAFPAHIGADDPSVTATQSSSATENIASGVYTKYTYQYVNIQGTVQTVGAAASNFVRYAEFPGQRLFKRVKFEVNGKIWVAVESGRESAPLVDYGADYYHDEPQ